MADPVDTLAQALKAWDAWNADTTVYSPFMVEHVVAAARAVIEADRPFVSAAKILAQTLRDDGYAIDPDWPEVQKAIWTVEER